MNILSSGLGKRDRERMTAILRGTRQAISVSEAAKILPTCRRQEVSKLLARLAAKGWMSRVKRGVYIPVPLESITAEIALEDPWAIAEKLYCPCYIGGWSAAEHWGLTEQIFRTIIVVTKQKPRDHNPIIKGTHFLLRTTDQKSMFGLQFIWRREVKVSISDPSRTILDLLVDPKLGGGIRTTIDIFVSYLASEYKNLKLLIGYAKCLNNGAVFKRLGYLLEQYAPTELAIIKACKEHLTEGKVKIDSQLETKKLITRWRLWVPKEWGK